MMEKEGGAGEEKKSGFEGWRQARQDRGSNVDEGEGDADVRWR